MEAIPPLAMNICTMIPVVCTIVIEMRLGFIVVGVESERILCRRIWDTAVGITGSKSKHCVALSIAKIHQERSFECDCFTEMMQLTRL